MEKLKETRRTFVCGIPLMEVCVYDVSAQANPPIRKPPVKQQQSSDCPDQQDQSVGFFEGLPNSNKVVPTSILVGSIVVLILAYYTIQYIAIMNCPEKLRLDNSEDSVRQYEAKLNKVEGAMNTTRQQNDKLNKDIARIGASKNDFERKLQEAETELSSLKTELASTKQQENKLKIESANLKSAKDTLSKDLDATKYTLGNCKNKNMDHEVRSLELLQENEGLKKELKAC